MRLHQLFIKKSLFREIFHQKVCTIRKNVVPLHPQSKNERTASVAQLVRAPDC